MTTIVLPRLALIVGMAAVGLAARTACSRTLEFPGIVGRNVGFLGGDEFPGARGGVSFPAADELRLSYDFSKGGRYVGFCLGTLEEGAQRLTFQARNVSTSEVSVSVRALDAKGDYYLSQKRLSAEEGDAQLSFDVCSLAWVFGASTNGVDRANIRWPLRDVCVLCQPRTPGRVGVLELRALRLMTEAPIEKAVNRSFRLLPRRFGSTYAPDETVVIPYRMDELNVGAEKPSFRLERIDVKDWRGASVWSLKDPAQTGAVRLGAGELEDRFGAFEAVFVGRTSAGDVQRLKSTWFARLTSAGVKPVKWIGTGGHGWGKDMRRYDLMATAGIGTFRNDASWADCERKPGVYTDPSGFFRENVAALRARGISLNLCMPHKNTGAYPENPFNSDAYAAFAEWVAKSYPEVDVFEIFNEPSAQYWQTLKAPWTHLFLDLTAKTKKRIRAVRPDADIVVCAECELRCLYWELEGGIAEKGDCVSFHPYVCNRLDPRPEDYDFFWNDEGREIRRQMADHGGADRLRITEIGWTNRGVDRNIGSNYWYKTGLYPGVSYEMQAQLLVRAFLIARSAGVESVMQYDFVNDGSNQDNSEHNFGIMFGDYTPKPSFAAIAAMARIVGEAEPIGSFSDDRDRYRVYGFRRPDGRRVYAMWAIRGPLRVDLPKDAVGGDVFDIMGNRRTLDPSLTFIELSERPHYILCLKESLQ